MKCKYTLSLSSECIRCARYIGRVYGIIGRYMEMYNIIHTTWTFGVPEYPVEHVHVAGACAPPALVA